MKNLNESIGLTGTKGMSHFDGVAVFDPETDSAVVSAKKQLTALVEKQNTQLLRKSELESNIALWKNQITASVDKFRDCNSKCNGNQACANQCESVHGLTGTTVANLNSLIYNAYVEKEAIEKSGIDTQIANATKNYQDAKTSAIEANNKLVEAQIKLLAEKAKTDPTALEQITKLNEQKLAGEQALAKQKIEADSAKNKSSSIKIYVIIGAVVLGLAAVAGLWIWLKSRKAV